MYKVVIVDDEKNGREVLAQLLQSFPNIEIVAFADSAEKGIECIIHHHPNIVFLDIEMPNGSGFQMLDNKEVQEVPFKVIFTTAFEQYAIKAIKYAALDYLLKPIDKNELQTAIERATSDEQLIPNTKDWIEDLKLSFNKSNKLKLVSKDGFELVNVNEIIYAKADANYTMFHFDKQPPILVSKTLKIYQLYLEQNGFIRIHRSHIINLNKMVKYYHGKGGQVTMTDGSTLDVGPDYRKDLMEALDNNK